MQGYYADMSKTQFEDLVVDLCKELLGYAAQGFTDGPDGGRDAKFEGTADLLPSKRKPWEGTVIVQAKHVNGYNRSCSENDFFSEENKSCVINKEIPRIQKLRNSGELDHYIIFTNRKLTGNAQAKITGYISQKCNIPIGSILLFGLNDLDTFLKRFSHLKADIDPIDGPLIISSQSLAEVIVAIADNKGVFSEVISYPEKRITYEEKNEINEMTDDFANHLMKTYGSDLDTIRAFLAEPENSEIVRYYDEAADEMQKQIIANRKGYQTFDKVMLYIENLLFNRDPDLKRNKKLASTVLFYMYWNCDIGKEDA